MESTDRPCDFCGKPAEYLISMDQKVQEDFQIAIGDMGVCSKCLPRGINLGIRMFGNELSICGHVGVK